MRACVACPTGSIACRLCSASSASAVLPPHRRGCPQREGESISSHQCTSGGGTTAPRGELLLRRIPARSGTLRGNQRLSLPLFGGRPSPRRVFSLCAFVAVSLYNGRESSRFRCCSTRPAVVCLLNFAGGTPRKGPTTPRPRSPTPSSRACCPCPAVFTPTSLPFFHCLRPKPREVF